MPSSCSFAQICSDFSFQRSIWRNLLVLAFAFAPRAARSRPENVSERACASCAKCEVCTNWNRKSQPRARNPTPRKRARNLKTRAIAELVSGAQFCKHSVFLLKRVACSEAKIARFGHNSSQPRSRSNAPKSCSPSVSTKNSNLQQRARSEGDGSEHSAERLADVFGHQVLDARLQMLLRIQLAHLQTSEASDA